MTQENNSTSAHVNSGLFNHWNTPLPYLFAGLALMLGLIAFSLLILACSYRNPTTTTTTQSSGNNDDDQEKSTRAAVLRPDEPEPRIVVIMAGDDNPTYLAKPTTQSTSHCDQQV
ncbi:protein GLUTAMINE DUMPER 2-like [Coffea arabica]|uniref:Protein GLUTAMINE DUMPER 2-like n=1 Tax=Coffea arabica TaxID=13443 RepID=A0A6P6T9U8_COFAR|nr:protein GLUTAMINE DUMPER 4-like [Coffea arabica]